MRPATRSPEKNNATLTEQNLPDLRDPDYTLIRIKDVAAMTGLARATLYKYMETDPTFPKAVPLSDSDARGAPIGFVLGEIQTWIKSRITARDKRS